MSRFLSYIFYAAIGTVTLIFGIDALINLEFSMGVYVTMPFFYMISREIIYRVNPPADLLPTIYTILAIYIIALGAMCIIVLPLMFFHKDKFGFHVAIFILGILASSWPIVITGITGYIGFDHRL